MEQVPAIKYRFEYSVDPIRGRTRKTTQIFVEAPYNFTATFGAESSFSENKLFLNRRSEPASTQKPTIDREEEPITEYQKCTVSKEWADECLKILDLEEQLNLLKNNATNHMPDELKWSV